MDFSAIVGLGFDRVHPPSSLREPRGRKEQRTAEARRGPVPGSALFFCAACASWTAAKRAVCHRAVAHYRTPTSTPLALPVRQARPKATVRGHGARTWRHRKRKMHLFEDGSRLGRLACLGFDTSSSSRGPTKAVLEGFNSSSCRGPGRSGSSFFWVALPEKKTVLDIRPGRVLMFGRESILAPLAPDAASDETSKQKDEDRP